MTRILVVCLGNICRSPLAHGILESKLPSNHFYVDSAGTASYHSGNQPDSRSIAVAKKYGLDISHQSARQFTTMDFDLFDYIYTMDQSNYNNIISLAKSSYHIDKVKLFLEENDTVTNKNVPDPYYGGPDGFERVYKLIEETSTILSEKLMRKHL
ncbi:MAG: low molecular weight phosphotyrosine protein phosphatase [Winogradskyella sp.]|uniref:low molecular weight protein-tyrosine-phosphatase n=1 Tax=Winogradskyella sp. TaxID=1883156 RepID=UPI0025E5455B|nr:low molecular weight protein-tyrosine-phosphatase [Winogradskyella sp.]NRB59247.1 low molecular weight phosphotyrosine protein phosphatase [Winogradskyella sp.]